MDATMGVPFSASGPFTSIRSVWTYTNQKAESVNNREKTTPRTAKYGPETLSVVLTRTVAVVLVVEASEPGTTIPGTTIPIPMPMTRKPALEWWENEDYTYELSADGV